ncbi:MAG: hypothetical protein HY436_01790 [Candidatus Liptonbacteria bacterium]|nr:hypothetical protein [Candidatus Liptonbacteria bacterium]
MTTGIPKLLNHNGDIDRIKVFCQNFISSRTQLPDHLSKEVDMNRSWKLFGGIGGVLAALLVIGVLHYFDHPHETYAVEPSVTSVPTPLGGGLYRLDISGDPVDKAWGRIGKWADENCLKINSASALVFAGRYNQIIITAEERPGCTKPERKKHPTAN